MASTRGSELGSDSRKREMEPFPAVNQFIQNTLSKDTLAYRLQKPASCPQSTWRPKRVRNTAHAQLAVPLSSSQCATPPTCQLQRSVRPQPHPFSGCPRLSRLQSPEVDVAARRRGRGGGRSASGETGPGLVFVNLPRSRRGQLRPRAWHGALRPGGSAAQRGVGESPCPAGFWKRPRASPKEFNWKTKTSRLPCLQTIGRSQSETTDSWNTCFPFGGH